MPDLPDLTPALAAALLDILGRHTAHPTDRGETTTAVTDPESPA